MDARSYFPRIPAALEKLQPRDHICLIYESPEEQSASVLPFLRMGLERREKCICLGGPALGQALSEHLRSAGMEPADMIRSGALTLASAKAVYMPDGRFDSARMLAFVADAAAQARAEGFSGLRGSDDMAWSLDGSVGVDRLLAYEAGLNAVCRESGITMLCQYDRRRFSPVLLTAVAQAHALGISGGKVFSIPRLLADETAAAAPRDTEFHRFAHALWDRCPDRPAPPDDLRHILDGMCTGVALVSPDRQVLHSNKQMRDWFPDLGRGSSPICYQSCNIPPRDEVCPYCPCELSKLDGLPHEAIVDFPAGDGVRSFRILASPIRNGSGAITAFVKSMEEITARRAEESASRETEEELRQAQKMEAAGKLAGGVAHDFNNLLTVIKGYAALLADNVDENPQNQTDVAEIIRAADSAAALTHQLLAFSCKQVLRPEVLDLNKAVRSMAMMLRRLIGEDVKLELSLDPALGQVLMDPVQTRQIILNLAANARDAMPEGGVLRIATDNSTLPAESGQRPRGLAPGRYVVLTISDSGAGMSADILARAFEPFFSTKERNRGTGLGLSTVYGIVKQSHGEIVMRSAPGAGTEVAIFMPFAPEASPPAAMM